MIKKYYKVKAIFVLIIIISTTLVTACGSKLTTLNGYLVDVCGEENPLNTSKECMLMKECEKNGYGISIKEDSGNYKYLKFDAEGHKKAKDILDKTDKETEIIIEVKGIKDGDTLKVSTIEEK